MHQIDPSLSAALVSIGVGVLMVRVGIGKRMLAWRTEGRYRRWRR